MTVLSVAKEVAKKVGLEIPDVLVSSTEREHAELLSVLNEMALRISRGHDWQVLSVVATVTGDGANEDFSLPSDYDRQLVKSQLWSSSLETPLSHISGLDEWLGLDIQSYDYVINAWIIYGGLIHIKPAMATGVTAKYFYQSNLVVSPAAGDNKATFTGDDDTFRIDEQLLKLGTTWLWKSNHGQPYAEDMADYEELKDRLVSRDKGSRQIRVGKIRMPDDVTLAYPRALGQ